MVDKQNDAPVKDWNTVASNPHDEIADDDMEESVQHTEAALEHPDYQQLENKLTAMEQKAHENWDKALRAMSELDNAKKRAARDVESAHKFALERFSRELLPVVDSLEQALQMPVQQSTDIQQVLQGIELTHKLFQDVLAKFNIKPIDPVGQTFDPNLHEAMSMQENKEVASGTVLVVYQKGYLLNDRMVRPARVIVAK